jgi:hypothetical protein
VILVHWGCNNKLKIEDWTFNIDKKQNTLLLKEFSDRDRNNKGPQKNNLLNYQIFETCTQNVQFITNMVNNTNDFEQQHHHHHQKLKTSIFSKQKFPTP